MIKVDAIMACQHFQQETHNFNKHENFAIIDQLKNTSKSKETLTSDLLKENNFGFYKHIRYIRNILDLVNSKHSNYNKILELHYIAQHSFFTVAVKSLSG